MLSVSVGTIQRLQISKPNGYSIIFKASGLLATFKTTTVAGLKTPDYDRTFSAFPVNLGVETNKKFNTINGIFEAGWIPFYQSFARKDIPDIIKRTNIAFYLQAGYKFYVDSTGEEAMGGEIDKSEEKIESGILRIKGSAGINTDKLIKITGLNVGLVGNADVWYDMVNNAFYRKIEARARFYVSETAFIDFIYQNGSGAPLFNYADQYGVGVSFRL